MTKIKNIFGGINLSWSKIIIFAIISGIYTALVCIIPQVRETSLHTIAVSFEVWILFGIFIITNSKSNIDSALKCFVFFLISQPLVYLLQVPFSLEGWNIFRYYGRWFGLTIACLPMGYIGYYIKKDKWWGYVILFPMIYLTAITYRQYLSYFTFCYPFYLLISIFCIVVLIIYPNVLFSNKSTRIVGTIISVLFIIVFTVINIIKPLRYSTNILSDVDGKDITDEYQVSLVDNRYGDVYIELPEWGDFYVVQADFKKKGQTELIIETPEGKIERYDLIIRLFSFEINKK